MTDVIAPGLGQVLYKRPVDYIVTRLYQDGIRLQARLRNAAIVRGVLSIVTEHSTEALGLRPVLVAKLLDPCNRRGIPHLLDVQLIGMFGKQFVLAGHEELEAGPMKKPCRLGQVWLVEPAAIDDLIRAEGKWASAINELDDLKNQFFALQAASART